MRIIPAIDLVGGKAVRLFKGNYDEMTVYSDDPPAVGERFAASGARHIHIVDLEGARDGGTPNFDTVRAVKARSGLFCEIGGGIRSMDVVERYLEEAGLDRVILGTAAVTDPEFLEQALERYGGKIAVGVDIRDGYVAIRGWKETSELEAMAFCRRMEEMGVRTLIVTDISRDGAMKGTNLSLYEQLAGSFDLKIVASGGVSDMEDVKRLAGMDLYGAIIGKAWYTGAIDLAEAVAAAGNQEPV